MYQGRILYLCFTVLLFTFGVFNVTNIVSVCTVFYSYSLYDKTCKLYVIVN